MMVILKIQSEKGRRERWVCSKEMRQMNFIEVFEMRRQEGMKGKGEGGMKRVRERGKPEGWGQRD